MAEFNSPSCSLTEAELKQRRADVRRDLVPHVASVARHPGEVELTFDAEIRSTVEDFVSLEQQCCGFLSFTLAPAGEPLVLTVQGPEGSGATLDMFARLARPNQPAP